MRRIVCLLFVISIVSSWTRAADIRIVGTDLLGADFAATVSAWAERNHLTVSVKLEGSRLGLDALSAREADLGLLAFAPGEALPQAPFILKPWAYEIAVIAVSERLPISQLSYAQLGGVFGVSGQTNISLWGELGAAGEWATRPVSAHALRTAAGSGVSLDLFQSAVLGNAALKSNVALYGDVPQLLSKLSAEEGSIAILPGPPASTSGLKILSIARVSGEPAFSPSAENIYAGDYPLRLPVYLVVPRENAAIVRPLLRFLQSDEALPLTKQARIILLPAGVREKETQELESL